MRVEKRHDQSIVPAEGHRGVSASSPRASIFALPLVLIASVGLSLLFLIPRLDESFDGGHEGLLSGRYFAGIQRAFAEGGLVAMRGRPVLRPLPEKPPTGATYANHPPLAHWLLRPFVAVVGLRERGFRLAGAVFSLVALMGLLFVLGRRAGAWALAAGALVYLVAPITARHGVVPSYEAACLAFGLPALLLASPERRSRTREVAAMTLFALAMLSSWTAIFFPAALFLDSTGSPGAGARFRRARPAALGSGIGLSVWFALLSRWEGGPAAAFGALDRGRGSAFRFDQLGDLSWWREIGENLVKAYGWPLLALTAAGTIVLALRRRRPESSRMKLLLVTGVVLAAGNTLVFPIQARWHDYWFHPLLPAVVAAGAAAITALRERSGFAALVVMLFVAITGAREITKTWDEQHRDRIARSAALLNERFGRDTLVVLVDDMSPMYFYLEAWCVDGLHSGLEILDLHSAWREGRFAQRRFLVVARSAFEDQLGAAAVWREHLGMTERREFNGYVFSWVDREP